MGLEKELEDAPTSGVKVTDKKERPAHPLVIGSSESSAVHQAEFDRQTRPKSSDREVEADVDPEVRGGLATKLHRVVTEIRQLAEDLDELADMLSALYSLLSGFETLGDDEESNLENSHGRRLKRNRSAQQSKASSDIDLEKILSLAEDSSELAQISALLKQIRNKEK